MKLVEKQIFITSIYSGEIESVDNNKILQEVSSIRSKDPGRKMPPHAGWHSNSISPETVENTEEIFKVVKTLYQTAADVSESMNYTRDLVLNACWININNPGNFNEQHRHPGTHLSAVYYIKALPNSGNISFIRDGRVEDYFPSNGQNNPYNAPRVNEEVKTNKFFIFPSYLDHKVDPNLSGEERISMAFNFSFS